MKAHLGAVAALALLATLASAQAPPARLSQQGDHWTAWNPPSSVPEGTQVYTVRQGDSLWGVAEQILGNPYLWPQIWELNPYIGDPAWIYPGDPLVLPVAGLSAEQIAAIVNPAIDDPAGLYPSADDAGPGMGDFTRGGPTGSASKGSAARIPAGVAELDQTIPVPIGYETDIYCTGYVGELEETFPFGVSGSEYEFLQATLDPRRDSNIKAEIRGLFGKANTQKYGLGLTDIVYLDSGRADGLSAGMLLTVIEPGELIIHPINDQVMGRYYHYRGRIRVLSVQDNEGIGEIVQLCDPIHVGARMQVFEPEPVPLRRLTPMRPINAPPRATELAGAPTIISAHDQIVVLAAGRLAYIDRGAEDDVAPGDIFTIFRQGRGGFPPILLGELGVLSVYKNTALVRIIRSRHTIYIGDVLLLK